MIEKKNFPPSLSMDTRQFIRFVQQRLHQQPLEPLSFTLKRDVQRISAVLFLLGLDTNKKVCLILNKRSRRVRQPGDLCCPGGGITPVVDSLLSKCLDLPFSPFSAWLYRKRYQQTHRSGGRKLKLLLATALREGVEEMRLNPFLVSFLGRLPDQQLWMFKRSIYPLVGWIRYQQRFFPNWEVDRIIRIPLRSFFEAKRYARFLLNADEQDESWDMPCFIHKEQGQSELLWGATYRISLHFLRTVFGFTEPPLAARPRVRYSLAANYQTGSKT